MNQQSIGAPDTAHLKISIIIPTLNEADNIKKLLQHISSCQGNFETIVVDGSSTDDTVFIAKTLHAKVLQSEISSRPHQLNLGAAEALGEVLYFVHADTLPPKNFYDQISRALARGSSLGSFRFRFDSNKRALRFTSYFTRFRVMIVRGGDQTLFILKKLFESVGGFDDSYVVMEEYDLIRRCKKIASFTLIQDDVIVSARKYEANSYPRVNIANLIVFTLYYCGVQPKKLLRIYKKLIRHPRG